MLSSTPVTRPLTRSGLLTTPPAAGVVTVRSPPSTLPTEYGGPLRACPPLPTRWTVPTVRPLLPVSSTFVQVAHALSAVTPDSPR